MKKIISIALLLIGYVVFSVNSYAAETATGYSVSPIFSTHQSEGVENFYDILWTPSVFEDFELKVTNNTDQDQTYKIEVNKARTNKNGLVDYSDSTPENSKVLYKLTEMIKMPKEVTVLANSSENVKGSIVFPEEDFNGLLMAGIHVSEKKVEGKQSTVSNSVAYNIPFVVRGNVDKRPDPIVELNSLVIEKFSSDTYAIDVALENKGPNLMKEVSFVSEITDESGKKVVREESQLDITPETEFIYPIKLPSDIKSGKYTLTLSIQHNEKNKWNFKEKFEITNQDVVNIKETTTEKSNFKMFIIAIIIVLVVGVVISRKLSKRSKKEV